MFSLKQNIPGIILSIDFEKACDTVWWKFISKTLDYFNCGESIKKMDTYYSERNRNKYFAELVHVPILSSKTGLQTR